MADTPFGFAGEYTDAETGFQYLQARYYDPATGQFLTPDPAFDLTGQRYAYASGDPLRFTDPSGQCLAPYHGVTWVLPPLNDVGQLCPRPLLDLLTTMTPAQLHGVPISSLYPAAQAAPASSCGGTANASASTGSVLNCDPLPAPSGSVGTSLLDLLPFAPFTMPLVAAELPEGGWNPPGWVVIGGTVVVGLGIGVASRFWNPFSGSGPSVSLSKNSGRSGGEYRLRQTSTGEQVAVRSANNSEVARAMHRDKGKRGGYRGKDQWFVDKDGNFYIGGSEGEIEPE